MSDNTMIVLIIVALFVYWFGSGFMETYETTEKAKAGLQECLVEGKRVWMRDCPTITPLEDDGGGDTNEQL